MSSLCISAAIPHTVLSELYQERLVTENDVKRKVEGGYLTFRLARVQCTKSPEVVTRTADILDKWGFNDEARMLRGW